MRKKDITAHVASEAGLTRRAAREAVDAVFGCISAGLLRGEEVRVAHFGAFAVSTRAAGAGRDFRPGARVPIPPTRRAVFRARVALRDGLNAGAGAKSVIARAKASTTAWPAGAGVPLSKQSNFVSARTTESTDADA